MSTLIQTQAPLDLTAEKPATAPTKARAQRRIYFVDLLRLVASFQMIHGHTLDALMVDDLRHGTVFNRWTFCRGLVSVSFMVAAGFSFYLSTLTRFETHRSNPTQVQRRFRRGFWLIVLGYLLHFPAGAFSGDAAAAISAWNSFQIADVLQCIGLCIVILECLTVTLRKPEHVVWAAGAFGLLAFGLAPLTDALIPQGGSRWITNYLTHRGGSLFPLFPWAGYVCAGLVAAHLSVPRGIHTPINYPLPRLLGITLGIFALWFVVDQTDGLWVSADIHANASPAFNLFKLGVVLGIVSLLSVAGKYVVKLPRFLQVLAGESLMLYAFHLTVLYGGVFGLYRILGHSLSLTEALVVAAVLIVVSAFVALSWNRIKATRKASKKASRPARIPAIEQSGEHAAVAA